MANFVYGSTTKSKLFMNSLSTVTGAFGTSRVECLYPETGEPALSLRRIFCYAVTLQRWQLSPIHSLHGAVLHPTLRNRYRLNLTGSRSVGVRFRQLQKRLNIRLPHTGSLVYHLGKLSVKPSISDSSGLWGAQHLPSPTASVSLNYFPATRTTWRCTLAGRFLLIDRQCLHIWRSYIYRLHTFNSVFTAELYAMYRALLFVRRQPRQYHLVCTDSLSGLQSLSGYSPDHPIVIELLFQLSHLHRAGKSAVFCWIPGHSGLPGNEAATPAALHGPLASDRGLGSDIRAFLRRAGLSMWQDECANTQGNKLRLVQPSVQAWQSSFSALRKEEVTLTLLLITHTRLTHGHLLCGEPAHSCGLPSLCGHRRVSNILDF
jgi:hypothetical protein